MALVLALTLGLGAGTSATAADGAAAFSASQGPAWEDELKSLAARLTRHIGELASGGSRVTGYPGATAAADYLVRELQSLGGRRSEVFRHPFQVTVPIDEGAGMSLDGRRLLLHCVWPNLVRTPTLPEGGVVGRLVYGGRAGRFELDGPSLRDAVVVLEYDCGMNWVTAFDLGAAAVIFLSPEGVADPRSGDRAELARAHRQEGAQKFLTTPADLPRFYAPRATSELLRRRLPGGRAGDGASVGPHELATGSGADGGRGVSGHGSRSGRQGDDDRGVLRRHFPGAGGGPGSRSGLGCGHLAGAGQAAGRPPSSSDRGDGGDARSLSGPGRDAGAGRADAAGAGRCQAGERTGG